jgi:hypothetical protein
MFVLVCIHLSKSEHIAIIYYDIYLPRTRDLSRKICYNNRLFINWHIRGHANWWWRVRKVLIDFNWFFVFTATFSNISAISRRPVLVMEEAGSTRREPQTMGKQLVTLSLAVASRVHPFCNLQSRAWTHAELVIGLYKLLGNPTT